MDEVKWLCISIDISNARVATIENIGIVTAGDDSTVALERFAELTGLDPLNNMSAYRVDTIPDGWCFFL